MRKSSYFGGMSNSVVLMSKVTFRRKDVETTGRFNDVVLAVYSEFRNPHQLLSLILPLKNAKYSGIDENCYIFIRTLKQKEFSKHFVLFVCLR
jgi:hypothetical protein